MTTTRHDGPRSGVGSFNRSVCVVIPMYNEGTVVADVIRGVRDHFGQVVCVDDGSRDDSARVAAAAGATVVRHAINLGQGAALKTGIDHALECTSADYIVTFDADGQHRVSDAIRMVETAMRNGRQVILGSRFLTMGATIPPARRAVLRAAVTFTRLTTGLAVTDTHNGLRVLSRAAAEKISITQSGMAHASELLHEIARNDLDYEEIPVSIDYTEYSKLKGQSNLNAVNIMHELVAGRMRAIR